MSEYWERVTKFQNNEKSIQQNIFSRDQSQVVIAGPGSGKTYLLAAKVAKVLFHDYIKSPKKVACLTYTNALERELKEDLKNIGLRNDKRLFTGTIHSFCIKEILLPFHHLYDTGIPFPIRIADESEALDALKKSLQRQDFEVDSFNDWSGLKFDLDNFRRNHFEKTKAEIANETKQNLPRPVQNINWSRLSIDYVDSLKGSEIPATDFVQIEIAASSLVKESSLVRKSLSARFPWWFIDEYQDISLAFHLVILSLLKTGKVNIFAIGDPNQCIFEELQGARPRLIYELAEKIKEINGNSDEELTNNYRSGQSIINLAEYLLEKNRDHRSKNKPDGNCRVYKLARKSLDKPLIIELLIELIERKKLHPQEIAILHPYRNELNQISYMLDAKGFGNKLDKDPEYQHSGSGLTSWVEDLANWCSTESFTNGPYFYDLTTRWITFLETTTDQIKYDAIFKYEKHLFETLYPLRNPNLNFANWFANINDSLSLDNIANNLSKSNPSEANDYFHFCEQLRTSRRLGSWTLSRFSKERKRTHLTTLHSCKGLQFKAVIISGFDQIGYGERKFNPTEIEKRLVYVASTRAEEFLFFIYSDQHPYFASKLDSSGANLVSFFEYGSDGIKLVE